MHMANLSRLDLNLLVVLAAIVEEGGVGRAAEKLNLTQPAVSHALSRLREALGDQLFERQGRSLVPTVFTKRLIEPLRRALGDLATLVDKGGGFDPARDAATFTVAMRDAFEVLILPPMMRRLAKLAPKVDLRSAQVRRRNVESGLADGTLDACVIIVKELQRPQPQQSQEWIARQYGKIDAALNAMEVTLGDQSFCMGVNYSLADIAVGCVLGYLDFRFPHIPWRDAHPNLTRLDKKLVARQAFIDSEPPRA